MAEGRGSEFSELVSQVEGHVRLLTVPEERQWLSLYRPPEKPQDLVLHLGCNILRTPHLAYAAVTVFRSLGLSVAPVAGPAFCCGIVQHRAGDAPAAGRLAASTISRLESYGAPSIAVWCPTCMLHFQEIAAAQPCRVPIVSSHQYLAGHLDRLDFATRTPARVALHVHEGTEAAEADAAAMLSLLRSVPGVEVIGTLSLPELDYQCQPTLVARLGRERFRALRTSLVDRAVTMGADILVTPYHSCQRNWCEVETAGLRVVNYISLIAEAMGTHHLDLFGAFTRLRDPDAAAALARDRWTAAGLSEDDGKRLAARYFE